MTEYDYSPEGYERYIATQNRVSNWVSDQVSRTPQHQAPFVARSVSQPPLQTRHSSSSTRDRHHSPSSSRSSSRPPPRRMHTTDVYHQSSRSGHASPPQYPPQYYQTTSPLSYAPPVPLPQGHNAMYKTYEYDHNTREIVLPPPRRGETYVIIPPNGRRVEVVKGRKHEESFLEVLTSRTGESILGKTKKHGGKKLVKSENEPRDAAEWWALPLTTPHAAPQASTWMICEKTRKKVL
ncbi:hypothetical protein PHLCEN_2v675 [Hermanssonia centrifuga]|uniref:Uncharacterized protein n=1 Tax=Hermanssonia centrifuga TaxID=98765 RepID=A0A2R6S5A8_9APHY|nr:hypothetical protein PHLCEN_2v675 [Hermanssonia centrifuga]